MSSRAVNDEGISPNLFYMRGIFLVCITPPFLFIAPTNDRFIGIRCSSRLTHFFSLVAK